MYLILWTDKRGINHQEICEQMNEARIKLAQYENDSEGKQYIYKLEETIYVS